MRVPSIFQSLIFTVSALSSLCKMSAAAYTDAIMLFVRTPTHSPDLPAVVPYTERPASALCARPHALFTESDVSRETP